MHDGRLGRRIGCGAHGAAPYTGLCTLVLLLLAVSPLAAAPTALAADGRPRAFEVAVAGAEVRLRLATIAGCRYRLTVTPGTLARPTLALGRPDEEPFVRTDAGAPQRAVVHVWDAERDVVLEARLGGFSALTGKGRVTLETLGPNDERVRAHRRFLTPTGDRARVGELLLGEPNRWELVAEPGTAYELTPTEGSAGRVRLRVLVEGGAVLADSETGALAWLAHPPVRFRAPAPPPGAEGGAATPGRLLLEVRGLFDGGGTYGLRMRRLGENQTVDPPALTPPEPVAPGPVAGQPQTFRAGPGDLAVLYVPLSPDVTQRVQVLRGDRWIVMDDIGRGGSARSQENALLVWFQPYYPGTYRFQPFPVPPPSEPTLFLRERAALGGAPIHMGTGVDPTVRARLSSSWDLVGLGICMPGWDYLFVCVGAPEQGVAMRVRDPGGKTVKTRAAGGRAISPGLGPSLRFRVRQPGIYRLEARSGRRQVIRALLRRASN